MKKILILVEGQTEKRFVNQMLVPHFNPLMISLIPTIVITRHEATGPDHKGGIVPYQKLKKQLLNLLNDTSAVMVTTMIDYYGLPNDFPGIQLSTDLNSIRRKTEIENCFFNDIKQKRFIPYIQLHEFEAILFSDINGFNLPFPDSLTQINELLKIRNKFESPEHINDDNPPSKRIISAFSDYDKVNDGIVITNKIGLEKIRKECPHFNEWIKKLETLGNQPGTV